MTGIRAEGLSVAIDGVRILDGVSLDVRPHEVLGIIGPNGAGKSTLLRSLAGLVRTSAGRVVDGEAGGRPLGSLSPRERAAHVAFVAQDTGIGADVSALDLVLLGRYAHLRRLSRTSRDDVAQARDALRTVGMTHLADRAVPSLSGGERQLVQIARALAQQAGTILLDEPTSALDVHHQLRVFAILRERAAAGIAVGVVLHDLNDASRYCDRLAVVHGGGLHAVGSPHEVLTRAMLAEVYRIDAHVHDDRHGYHHVHPIGIHTALDDVRMPSDERISRPVTPQT